MNRPFFTTRSPSLSALLLMMAIAVSGCGGASPREIGRRVDIPASGAEPAEAEELLRDHLLTMTALLTDQGIEPQAAVDGIRAHFDEQSDALREAVQAVVARLDSLEGADRV
ncbi:MAG: hypothetical protein KC561_17025, partial [Myxococcales bacterium]|nr:hypothetical protein [Myxococcales bacterium]